VTTTRREELVAGARAVAPMLVGVVPFGLVAGASPMASDLGGAVAVGLSTIVFAGASQLAAIDVLADGGGAWVAIVAACTINLRILLYSASLAPHLALEPLRRRLLMAYLLTDQAYAVSITRWTEEGDAGDPDRRAPYYLGAALTLWASWQLSTIAGLLVGSAVPDALPLDFAVPLVFLVLLVPAITTRPAAVAGAVGGLAAVAGAELGADNLSVLVGAVSGIAAGAVAEWAQERRARDDTPLPPDPGPIP
jgi:predicted branched-subunit amino acid permease